MLNKKYIILPFLWVSIFLILRYIDEHFSIRDFDIYESVSLLSLGMIFTCIGFWGRWDRIPFALLGAWIAMPFVDFGRYVFPSLIGSVVVLPVLGIWLSIMGIVRLMQNTTKDGWAIASLITGMIILILLLFLFIHPLALRM